MKKRGKKNFSKKSQITIWVVIALLLVSIILLFFMLKSKKTEIKISEPTIKQPEQYIKNCIKENVLNAVDIMLPQGGYISPTNYKLYENNKVGYLCYTNKYYHPCINQQPLYIEFLEQEIHDYVKPKIEDCFYSLREEYEKNKYDVVEGPLSLQINLAPKQINVNVEKKFEITKNEETRKFNKFNVKINSPLYDLAVVAQEIASQEAKYCYFEYLGYSLLYPQVSIEKNQVGSEETAYR